MRFPSSFFNLAATAGRKGVLLEDTDGELVVPALLQPVVVLPSPIPTNLTAQGTQTFQQSNNNGFSQQQIGAVAGAAVTFDLLSAGLWRIVGSVSLQFTGTTDTARALQVTLRAPDFSNWFIADWRFFNPTNLVHRFDFILHTTVDGWGLRFTTSASQAGDNLAAAFWYQAQRILV